jgi:hypothetical protein
MTSVTICWFRFFVNDQRGVGVVDSEISDRGRHPEISVPRQHQVAKGRALGGLAGAQVEPDGSALHRNNGVVAVLSSWRRRQTNNILGFNLPHDLLETESRQMVALIGNHLPVLATRSFTSPSHCKLCSRATSIHPVQVSLPPAT